MIPTAQVELPPFVVPEKSKPLPPFGMIYGPPGVGKTSLPAFAQGAAIVMAQQEQGYMTLVEYGRAPRIPAVTVSNWEELQAWTKQLINECSHKVLIFDSLGPLERMCHEYTCRLHYGNDWSDSGFASYQRGYDVSLQYWRLWLQDLERLRREQSVAVLLVGHAQPQNYKNPMGDDYFRMVPCMHRKTFDATLPDMDFVFLYTFVEVTDKKDGRKKGIGGQDRIIYTTHRDSHEAKNRMGLPETIAIPADPAQGWPTLMKALKEAKQ